MLPPAPPRVSITTCWPHTSESRSPMTRAMMSVAPPAANGTITRTKRFGQACCANAGRATRPAEAAARKRRRSSMALAFALDAGGLDHRLPQVGLGAQMPAQFLGRRADD